MFFPQQTNEEEERVRIESFKRLASEQRIVLSTLYCDKQRPQVTVDEKVSYYGILQFIHHSKIRMIGGGLIECRFASSIAQET